MYSERAKRQRKCLGITKKGQPCRAYATWDGAKQLCVCHAGRHHTGEMPFPPAFMTKNYDKTKYIPCKCIAYQWPHRTGGGLCQWPDFPQYRLTTPAGTPASLRTPKSVYRLRKMGLI